MKLKIDKFCGIANSNEWQKWLYDTYREKYHDLVNHLRTSTGCRSNADKMRSILEEIIKADGTAELYEFLLEVFPNVVEIDEIFPHYDPDLYTIPHRKIFRGRNDLKKLMQEFLADKHEKYEMLVIGEKGYLEYLDRHFDHNKIPEDKWLIAAFKRRKNMV